MSFLCQINLVDDCQIVEYETLQMIRSLIHIHCDDQWSIKLCIAEKLNRMGVRIPREFEAITF